jgi:cell division protein FtsW
MIKERYNKNFLNSWWNNIDRVIFGIVLALLFLGSVFVATASTGVAERIGIEQFYFVKRQIVYVIIAFLAIFIISNISSQHIIKSSFIGFAVFLLLMTLVLLLGDDIKGAKRWISLAGISIQPSEFIKPFFIIITGWVLSKRFNHRDIPVFKISFLLYLLVIGLLVLQPDMGMVITVTCVWMGQLFLAGISLYFIFFIIVFGIAGLISAYILFSHVAQRINNFLDPGKSENYQIKKSIEAFVNGGLYGRGPGEGIIKQHIPDSHSDFIFSVIGEEFGLIVCIIVTSLYLALILRGLQQVIRRKDPFIILTVSGLLMQFGMQAFVNIGVTLHILPTKGMTLPFISYGGSSIIAIALSIGYILALTKKRYGTITNKNFDLLINLRT